MQAFASAFGGVLTVNVKDPAFALDKIASALFSVAFLLDLVYIMTSNFSGVQCRIADISIDMFLNGTAKSQVPDYINTVCGTEIRFKRIYFYLAKIAVMCIGLFIILGCRSAMSRINRNGCILNGQKLTEYLQNMPVPLDIGTICDSGTERAAAAAAVADDRAKESNARRRAAQGIYKRTAGEGGDAFCADRSEDIELGFVVIKRESGTGLKAVKGDVGERDDASTESVKGEDEALSNEPLQQIHAAGCDEIDVEFDKENVLAGGTRYYRGPSEAELKESFEQRDGSSGRCFCCRSRKCGCSRCCKQNPFGCCSGARGCCSKAGSGHGGMYEDDYAGDDRSDEYGDGRNLRDKITAGSCSLGCFQDYSGTYPDAKVSSGGCYSSGSGGGGSSSSTTTGAFRRGGQRLPEAMRMEKFTKIGSGCGRTRASRGSGRSSGDRGGSLSEQPRAPGLARKTVETYNRYKAWTLLAYCAVWGSMTTATIAWRDWRDVITPDRLECYGDMQRFNEPRGTTLYCHLIAEWEAFITEIVATAFSVAFIAVYAASIKTTSNYIANPRNFELVAAMNHALTPGIVSPADMDRERFRLYEMLQGGGNWRRTTNSHQVIAAAETGALQRDRSSARKHQQQQQQQQHRRGVACSKNAGDAAEICSQKSPTIV